MRYDRRLPLCIAASGLAAALLAACGGSSGLIPSGNAGPLRSDFEAVAEAAENGNGDCSRTHAAIGKTERDFESLPSSVDRRLRNRLSEGIDHLRSQALLACTQPSGAGTSTTATVSSPPSSSSPPTSTSTSTSTVTSTSTSTTSAPSGGTPAEEGEGEESNPGGVGPNGEGPPGHVEHGGAVP